MLEHVKALTVDIGPRTPFVGDSLARAAAYIQSAFENAGLSVREQPYQYHGQRVVNLLATAPATTEASAYYVVGAHYDTVATTPGADDNASAVAVMLELARRLPEANLRAPVLFAAFTLEEPPAFRQTTKAAASSRVPAGARATPCSGRSSWRWSVIRRTASAIHFSPAGPVILPKATSSGS